MTMLMANMPMQQLSAKVASAQQATKEQDDSIAKQIDLLDQQRAAIADAFKDERGKIGHLVYEYEMSREEFIDWVSADSLGAYFNDVVR